MEAYSGQISLRYAAIAEFPMTAVFYMCINGEDLLLDSQRPHTHDINVNKAFCTREYQFSLDSVMLDCSIFH